MELKRRIEILEEMLGRYERGRIKKILKDKIAGYFNQDEHGEMSVLVLTIYDYKKIANEKFLEDYRSKGLSI